MFEHGLFLDLTIVLILVNTMHTQQLAVNSQVWIKPGHLAQRAIQD